MTDPVREKREVRSRRLVLARQGFSAARADSVHHRIVKPPGVIKLEVDPVSAAADHAQRMPTLASVQRAGGMV
jgi:hypothetical protein